MIEKHFIEINLNTLTGGQRERLYGFLGDWKIPYRQKTAHYVSDAERIRRDMVLENNRIAAQYDATYGSDGIMQFDDPYQAMAFLVFGARED